MKKFDSALPRLRHFWQDKKRKGIFSILRDVLLLTIHKKGFPFYYFGRMIYRGEAGNCRNYFSTREFFRIYNSVHFNDPEYLSIMHNKLMLAFFCEKWHIPSPKLLGYNLRDQFYFRGESFRVSSLHNLIEFFKQVFRKTGTDRIFIKPQMSKGGAGAFILHHSSLQQGLEDRWKSLREHFYLFQEVVVQHPEISRIYPQSLNTLRINTFTDREGSLHFLPTVMRFGMGGNVVDNHSQGGVYVITDNKKGTLGHSAKTALVSGSTDFTVHPDSGITFYDYTIPFYKEAHEFCKQLSALLPNKLTGWDVAITPAGPLLVEANANPDFLMGELEHGGYLQYPVFRKILAYSRQV